MKTIESKIPLHEPVKDAVTVPPGVEYLPLVQWLMEKPGRKIIHRSNPELYWTFDGDENLGCWESDTLIGLMHEMGLVKKPTA